MDLASIIGMLGCAAAVVYGIVSGDQGFAALGNFYDFSSILITIGGSFMCMLTMSDSIPAFFNSLKSFKLVLKTPATKESEIIHTIIDLANVARKEGLLQLEEAAADIDDDFLKKGIMLIVDGTDQELVTSILDTELNSIERRHNKVISFWDGLAAMGPAWGMIGTLIGLINMLKLLDDPSSIGPNMAELWLRRCMVLFLQTGFPFLSQQSFVRSMRERLWRKKLSVREFCRYRQGRIHV